MDITITEDNMQVFERQTESRKEKDWFKTKEIAFSAHQKTRPQLFRELFVFIWSSKDGERE